MITPQEFANLSLQEKERLLQREAADLRERQVSGGTLSPAEADFVNRIDQKGDYFGGAELEESFANLFVEGVKKDTASTAIGVKGIVIAVAVIFVALAVINVSNLFKKG